MSKFTQTFFYSEMAFLGSDHVNFCELENGEIVPYTECSGRGRVTPAAKHDDWIYLGKGRWHHCEKKRPVRMAQSVKWVEDYLDYFLQNLEIDQDFYDSFKRALFEASLEKPEHIFLCHICKRPQHKKLIVENREVILCMEIFDGYLEISAEITCKCCRCSEEIFDNISPEF